jgi:hypothetical protein
MERLRSIEWEKKEWKDSKVQREKERNMEKYGEKES